MNIKRMTLFFLILMISLITACSNESGTESENNNENENNITNNLNEKDNKEDDSNNESQSAEKTKITIAYQWNEASFYERFDPIEELLGNVEIEYVPTNGTKEGFEELFSAGIHPDIFMDQNLFALKELEVIYPLDSLIEKSDFNIDMIDKPLLDWISAYDDEERVIGLPDGTGNVALYYNEEVFDMLGEDYPDPLEPMTWNEVMDLNRRMTTVIDDVQYIGLDLGIRPFPLQQFEPNATDPDTGEVLVNEDEAFKRYFELYAEYHSVPGINEETLENAFLEKRAGMVIAQQVEGLRDYAGGEPGGVELAPIPVWEDRPKIGPYTGTTPMIIAEYSENKELALEILEAYFDPEIILQPTKAAAVAPPLSDPEIYTQFATEHELYQGKNLDAFHVLETASPEERVSRWDDFVDIHSAEKAIREGEDVVTVLRKLEEESEAKIKEAMSAQ